MKRHPKKTEVRDKHFVIVSFLIVFSFLGTMPNASANPIPRPFIDIRDPLKLTGAELQLVNASVYLDCFRDHVEGYGLYYIKNVANSSVNFTIEFNLGYQNFTITNFKINNTPCMDQNQPTD